MECANIKQLLPKYVDGILNEQKKTIVEGHLANCEFCSEELALLRAYAKQRIKIPLKIAAVVVTAVLAVFVFKVVRPAKEISHAPLIPEPKTIVEKPKIAEKPEEVPIKITRKEEVKKEEVKEEVVKTAVFLEPEPAAVLATARAPIEEKTISLTLLVEPEASTITHTIEEPDEKSASFAQRVRLTDILAMIKNLTSILEGKVISVEYKEGTKIPQCITAEIPPNNYKTFLQKLALYGSVENPSEVAVPLTKNPVSIKIKLAYSE